jgi:hypothetical protein
VLLVPVPAFADPGFVTLDRQSAESSAGGELSYLHIGGGNTLLRLDVHGQYVTPSGFGGYAAAPLAIAFDDNDAANDLGDLEAGVIYAPHLSSPSVGVVVHAGLTVPTETDGEDGILSTYAAFARLPAFDDVVPHGTSLRLGVSPTLRSGQLFARADLGFDHNLAACEFCGDVYDLLRLDAGVGVDLGDVAVMGELATVTALRDGDDSSFETAAVSLRGRTGRLEPYAALVIPLDSALRDAYDFALTVGVDTPLR